MRGDGILLQEEDDLTVERAVEDDPEAVRTGKPLSTDPRPLLHFFPCFPSFVYGSPFLPGDLPEIR